MWTETDSPQQLGWRWEVRLVTEGRMDSETVMVAW